MLHKLVRLALKETTHTPQGDGNFFAVVVFFFRRGNNPHPARGRKHFLVPPKMFFVWETTHTPQGDGNSAFSVLVGLNVRNNPHPARERKTICVYIAEIVGETIHIPARGQLTKKERETR